MRQRKFLIGFLIMTATIVTAGTGWAEEAAPAPTTPPAAATIDARAMDTLKLMSEKLSQAKTLRFEARSSACEVTGRNVDQVFTGLRKSSRKAPKNFSRKPVGTFFRTISFLMGKP